MSNWTIGKVDFHLHSHASNVTDYYAANSFSIPESYSDPFEVYDELKRQGMTLVTLTDHNSIDGVRALLDRGLRDVFISAEMTTTFPEDGCNIHVTVANMTEAQFAEVHRLRGNIYEMIDYVDAQIAREAIEPGLDKLAYFMTHPLMSTQNRPYGREGSLTVEHIERALLLCNCFEVRNGTRTRSLNELTMRLLERIDRETIERLANKHGIAPKGPTPWLKSFVGGSDDHSGINPGQTWTEFAFREGEIATPNDVIESIRRRETRAGGACGGPVTLAHAMVKLLYDGGTGRGAAANSRSVSMGGPLNSLLRFVFDRRPTPLPQKIAFGARAAVRAILPPRLAARRRADAPFERVLTGEAAKLLADPGFRRTLAACRRTDDRIFTVVSSLVNRIFLAYVTRLRRARVLDLMRTIKEVVALVSSNLFVSLPYLISYFHQGSDRLIVRDVRRAFDIAARPKLVLFTDTLFEVNGVARSIRRMMKEAERRHIDLTVVTCLSVQELAAACADPEIEELLERGRLKVFESIVNLDFPEYEGLQIRFPPFLEMLKFCQESGFTKVQISTPGTVGLAGLMAAKVLQIETSSTYHTSFPEYVENYTNDISLEALTWKYMILFYHSVDEVVVPSRFIAKLLHERGLRKRKLLVLDRWVDVERFHPRKRIDGFWNRFGVADESRMVKFVYVGRVGVEKNLRLLADAFLALSRAHDGVHLVIVGDGPYRRELEQRLSGAPVTFTGFLHGEELCHAIASADVKVFPSTTDTWGNAVLEAQACGLPVIVSDKGGPQELMLHEVTGLRIRSSEPGSLLDAMKAMLDPDTRRSMATAARDFTVRNRVEEPFTAILDSEAVRARLREERKMSKVTSDAVVSDDRDGAEIGEEMNFDRLGAVPA